MVEDDDDAIGRESRVELDHPGAEEIAASNASGVFSDGGGCTAVRRSWEVIRRERADPHRANLPTASQTRLAGQRWLAGHSSHRSRRAARTQSVVVGTCGRTSVASGSAHQVLLVLSVGLVAELSCS
jgi:hypothetical protein